jgi:hypothetical protein
MHADVRCPDPDCPNRGILVLDANAVLFLVEGAIRYAHTLHPDLTNANRLPYILEELGNCLGVIRGRCSLNGNLYISEQVLGEVTLESRQEIERKGLIELKKYNRRQRRRMQQVVYEHFPQPVL